MGSTLRMWLRSRQLAARLAQADAEALIRDLGGEAYYEARRRERDVVLPDGTRELMAREHEPPG
jgi:hypothetical protein